MFIIKIITVLMPWYLKRFFLVTFFKYEIHPSARIGFSWVFPDKLVMKQNARIGLFNVAVHLDLISLSEYATISRGNWITGFSSKIVSKHFLHQKERKSQLLIGKHSAITKNHHIDCTNVINIGNFVTIAGYGSQFLTHSINIEHNRQDSYPITIGNYCFVGTSSIVLGGALLPSYSVLGAMSLLNKKFDNEYRLYGGNPAKEIKELSKEYQYFNRIEGFVY